MMASLAQVMELWRSGRREEAEQRCERLAHDGAQSAEALDLLAEMYMARGAAAQAAEALLQLVGLGAAAAGTWRRLGDAQLADRQYAAAEASFREATKLEPESVRGHNNLGQALMRLGRRAEAIDSYRRALELDSGYAIGHNNLGLALHEDGDGEAALASFARALQASPQFAEAHLNIAHALMRMGRPALALESYQRALALQPRNAAAHDNRGGALHALRRYTEAIAACDQSLALQPGVAMTWANRASALLALGRVDEALADSDRALAIDPDLIEALSHRGAALMATHQPAQAAHSLARLLAISPQLDLALGALENARGQACDWHDYDARSAQLVAAIERGQRACHPFLLLSRSDSPAAQLRCARAYAAGSGQPVPPPLWMGQPYGHEKIRVAYLSADFRVHATADLAVGLFEAHDRARFETVAISYGQHDGSAMRARLEAAFSHFIEVGSRSDSEVAQLLRSLEVDIAVDLKGYTHEARPGILAHRPAPVQVNYLGYPGTMGSAQLDYIIADRVVIPPGDQQHYAEQVVYLPDCYQPNDRNRTAGTEPPTRAAVGLPDDAFVFCSFNNNYKLTPGVFACWMRLLQQLPASVLWLLEDNADAARNLREQAARQGIADSRLVFAPRVAGDEHLARQRLADLCLDTLPYNAHTTASDALWVGLPLLTCRGATFAGRVAASLLAAAGLPDLVTSSLEEYEALALRLAREPQLLANVRARLARNRLSCPLFDTDRYRRHLEAAYIVMNQRQRQGLAPASFHIGPGSRDTALQGNELHCHD
jgi:predicted O-linked N-acetylglucosamine transferase (SPINDLY family)